VIGDETGVELVADGILELHGFADYKERNCCCGFVFQNLIFVLLNFKNQRRLLWRVHEGILNLQNP